MYYFDFLLTLKDFSWTFLIKTNCLDGVLLELRYLIKSLFFAKFLPSENAELSFIGLNVISSGRYKLFGYHTM